MLKTPKIRHTKKNIHETLAQNVGAPTTFSGVKNERKRIPGMALLADWILQMTYIKEVVQYSFSSFLTPRFSKSVIMGSCIDKKSI